MNAPGFAERRAESNSLLGCSPIVIIGAGRSGTNMLRDALVKLPGVGTWPCDEINYIWRHGNKGWPTDEFPVELVNRTVRRFVRGAFGRLARRHAYTHVVEKTCANSLRVGFVDAIIPEARFLFIVRDGRDVIASAAKRWTAELEPGYLARKARYVPLGDIPYYAVRYLGNRIYRCWSTERRLAFWGPKFTGMTEALKTQPLEAVCALQWKRCVEMADQQLSILPRERVHRLGYEQFVGDPAGELAKVCEFLRYEVTAGELTGMADKIFASSIGKWRESLSGEAIRMIEPILGDALERFGYER